MTTEKWSVSFNKNTTNFFNTKQIQDLINAIKKEALYKEEIIRDFIENEDQIKKLENNTDNFFNIDILLKLVDLYFYRDDYYRVIADMENNIRIMFWRLNQIIKLKFQPNKANIIMRHLSCIA